MIFAGFSLLKLFSGFNIFNGEKLGKLLYNIVIVVIVVILMYALYHKLISPTHTTTVQSGGTANNYEIKIGFGGCARLPIIAK